MPFLGRFNIYFFDTHLNSHPTSKLVQIMKIINQKKQMDENRTSKFNIQKQEHEPSNLGNFNR